MSIVYLTIENIRAINAVVLDEHGGADGVLFMDLLESTVEMPRSAFGGQDLYPDLVEKAAAYLFFIIGNHPFRDGNKRTGLAAALTFLELNGHSVTIPQKDWPMMETLVLKIAGGELDRAHATARFRNFLEGPA
jgi:death-on-curing protein